MMESLLQLEEQKLLVLLIRFRTRKFIDEFSNINEMDVTQELDSQRLGDIENQSVIDLADFRAAHCTSCAGEGCYGYYFKAVAEGNCALCEKDDG